MDNVKNIEQKQGMTATPSTSAQCSTAAMGLKNMHKYFLDGHDFHYMKVPLYILF